MAKFARIILLLVTATSPLIAQSAATGKGPFIFSAALGPARTFRGVDAIGIHAQGAISVASSHGFGFRLEGTGQWYDEQPQYPCLIQDAARCYQTLRRALSAGIVSATYDLSRFASDSGRTMPYLISGLGIYRSRRVATHYPDCQPGTLCDSSIYKLEMRDTQWGWSGGAGVDFRLASMPVIFESRVHYVYSDTPRGGPSNDYFVWPFSVGVRF